jgi:hypothetical protein
MSEGHPPQSSEPFVRDTSDWNVQEMPVTGIWLQPASEGREACVIMEMAAGPKRFARFFPHSPPPRIEWGWSLGSTAVKVWPVEP